MLSQFRRRTFLAYIFKPPAHGSIFFVICRRRLLRSQYCLPHRDPSRSNVSNIRLFRSSFVFNMADPTDIPIPCRPQKTFVVLVLDVPEDLPEEDIRHALYKFQSVVEVSRVHSVPTTNTAEKVSAAVPGAKDVKEGGSSTYSPPLVRITLASMDECNTLLQNGLDFYGATFFPTEPGPSNSLVKVVRKSSFSNVYQSGKVWETGRVKELLPVFDSSGFAKIPPPPSKTIKPRN